MSSEVLNIRPLKFRPPLETWGTNHSVTPYSTRKGPPTKIN